MNSNKNKNNTNKASIFGDDEDSEEEVGKVEQLTGFNSGEAKGWVAYDNLYIMY